MKSSRDKILDAVFEEVYIYGYNGTSISSILKSSGVVKGSMYHHFKSKKEMVLAMIDERLIPQVENFFDFKMKKSSTALNILETTMKKIANNKTLIAHGCPLHRLMFEMSSQDVDIAKKCEDEFEKLSSDLGRVIEFGIKNDEIKKYNPKQLSSYIIASTWGFLSRPPKDSSKEQFLKDATFLIESIKV